MDATESQKVSCQSVRKCVLQKRCWLEMVMTYQRFIANALWPAVLAQALGVGEPHMAKKVTKGIYCLVFNRPI